MQLPGTAAYGGGADGVAIGAGSPAWQSVVSRVSRFSLVHSSSAREEAVSLRTLATLQETAHRVQRHMRTLHAWRGFLAADSAGHQAALAAVERNERTCERGDPHQLPYAAAKWAHFVRLARTPQALALLALPSAASGAGRDYRSASDAALDERDVLGETLVFALFGGAAAERELACFRRALRAMLRAEVRAARAAGSLTHVVEFWQTVGCPVPEKHVSFGSPRSPTAPTSVSKSILANGSATKSILSTAPPSSSAASASGPAQRPLRMVLLELMLRRCTSGGAFLATVLDQPLRVILQADKRNLDPQESVVSQLLGGGTASASASPALAPLSMPSPALGPTPVSLPDVAPAGDLFPAVRRQTVARFGFSQGVAVGSSPSLTGFGPPPSAKVAQAVRVTEKLLCAAVDALLDALLHAGPRWPLGVKLLLGDMLRCSADLWSTETSSADSDSRRPSHEKDMSSTTPPTPTTPVITGFTGSPPSPSVPYTVAEGSILGFADETSTMFTPGISGAPIAASSQQRGGGPTAVHRVASSFLPASSAAAAAAASISSPTLSSTASVPGSTLSPMSATSPFVGSQLSPPLLPPRSHRAHSLIRVGPAAMQPSDAGAVLAQLLFGLLILPALQKPGLSGLYTDAAVRTRAKLNLRVVCTLVEQVVLGVPFPPSSHLGALNRYVLSKAAIVRKHMDQLAAHCVHLVTKEAGRGRSKHMPSTANTTPTNITPTAAQTADRRPSVFPEFGSAGVQMGAFVGAPTSAVDDTNPSAPDQAILPPAEPPLVLPHASVCLTLTELTTLQRAMLRHLPRLRVGTKSERALAVQLSAFENLPLAAAADEPEWHPDQVLEIELTDSQARGRQTSDSSMEEEAADDEEEDFEPFPRLTSLSSRVDAFVRSSSAASTEFPTAPAFELAPLLTLMAQTFLALPPEALRSFAGRPGDLVGLLSHARHAMEAALSYDFEAASHALAHVGELESSLRQASTCFVGPPPGTVRQGSLGTATAALRALAAPSTSIVLAPELNRLLFTHLQTMWNAFETNALKRANESADALLHSRHLLRKALIDLRAEAHFLRDLNFANKVSIFARERRNVAQSIHLGKIRFVLPTSFASFAATTPASGSVPPTPEYKSNGVAGSQPPPLVLSSSGRDLASQGQQGGSCESKATIGPTFTCTSVEGFLDSFEALGPAFAQDLPVAAKLLSHTLRQLEAAIRDDVGLHTFELGAPNMPTAAAKAAAARRDQHDDHATPHSHQHHGSPDEFVEPALHGEALVTKAIDLLELSLSTRLYPWLFPSDRSSVSFEDEILRSKLVELGHWLLPKHVHLPGVAADDACWSRPLATLAQLEHAHSASAKLAVLTRALRWLAKALGVKPNFRHMDADSTLSGLIFLVVKAAPSRLLSHLLFIETYLPAAKLAGEREYVLTQWSLAAHYISETLAAYDRPTLEAEMAAQLAREERSRRDHEATSPTSQLQRLSVALQQHAIASPSRTRANSGAGGLAATGSDGISRRSTFLLPGVLDSTSSSTSSPPPGASPAKSLTISVGGLSPPLLGQAMPPVTASFLLALSFRASRDRSATRVGDASCSAAMIVFRAPALCHRILAMLPAADTARLATVSNGWRAHALHATRRATLVTHAV